MSAKIRVCYVVCYKDPNYVRTNSLVNALASMPDVELTVVKNHHRGPLRYIEVPLRLLAARLKLRPDTFVIGFRAQEIFWALYPAMAGKRKIFDEFINLHDYLVDEHHIFKPGSLTVKVVDAYMRWVVGRCRTVLTDTPVHADLSSRIYAIDRRKFLAVPVGTDEDVFKPLPHKETKDFSVLFYGTMLPLHGLDVILEAAAKLKDKQNVKFRLVGARGNSEMRRKINGFIADNGLGDKIELIDWIDYADLPASIAKADLCLGGPFGVTGQAGRVVTGKTYQFLAMARPAVIGRSPATGVFKDRKNCLLADRGSAQSLADAIAWAASHRRELAKISEGGRRLYEKEFSISRIADLLAGELK